LKENIINTITNIPKDKNTGIYLRVHMKYQKNMYPIKTRHINKEELFISSHIKWAF